MKSSAEVEVMTMARCWLCGGQEHDLVKAGSVPNALDGAAFRITDSSYGISAPVYRCRSCGFRQCHDLRSVLPYYAAMEDPAYETSRAPRALQARKLVEQLRPFHASGRLLDIGAGSGILVEEAARLGYAAEGIDPSVWLAARAAERGLKVYCGVLPGEVAGPFDLVTLVDVIEHVSDPVELLRQARAMLAPGGIGLIITPDVASLAARMMGARWWHYRIAHICYFDRRTLCDALKRAELAPVRIFRPSWFFSLDYLLDRLAVYAPPARMAKGAWARSTTVPLNLFDSLGVIFKKD